MNQEKKQEVKEIKEIKEIKKIKEVKKVNQDMNQEHFEAVFISSSARPPSP